MIRLIASDIDGTLLPYGRTALDEGLFDLIRQLAAAGIRFCPASGRQYHSLRGLFAPVAEEVCFLCENGAAIFGPGPEDEAPLLAKTPMPRADALELARDILALPECEVVISGGNVSYLCGCGAAFAEFLARTQNNRVAQVADVADIQEDILKVTAFTQSGLAGPMAALGPRWGARYHMAEAGAEWLDFGLADKGTGLRSLCAALGIDPAETAAFGDNWNDVAMLETAGAPYLMDSAAPALLARFPRHCRSVAEELKALLA